MDSQTGRIVVGYDGSPLSSAALDWAAVEARRRRLPLTVLHAVDFGTVRPTAADAPLYPALNQEVSSALAREGAARARVLAPGVDIVALAHLGQATHTLIDASRGARLVVVGANSDDVMSTALLGSVALTLSARALCPVVVVRGDPPQAVSPPGRVVVGVDGSACSAAALLYAADLAGDIGTPLVVVSIYQRSLIDAWAGALDEAISSGTVDSRPHVPTGTAAVAANAVRSAKDLHAQLDVGSLVLEGPAADLLCQAAVDAQMLVIGSRGHGRFADLILGSVSRSVLQLAPCPVTVIKTPALDTR